jgi:hypothetical protein
MVGTAIYQPSMAAANIMALVVEEVQTHGGRAIGG